MDMHQAKARLPCLSPLMMLALRLPEQQIQVHLLQLLAPFEQWGESTSPITFTITFNVLYAYEMLHNSSLRHKTLPMAGANDGSRLFFDLWNIQANDYDAAGTAIYIAIGK